MNDLTYAVEQRLRFIDFLLAHYGTLNRTALMDYFGISTPQASRDIATYLQMTLHPNAVYDHHAKMYMRSPTFARVFP